MPIINETGRRVKSVTYVPDDDDQITVRYPGGSRQMRVPAAWRRDGFSLEQTPDGWRAIDVLLAPIAGTEAATLVGALTLVREQMPTAAHIGVLPRVEGVERL